ncbi:VPLPA-CTERM sorting domain-containing protein [Sedimentitalea sp. JM2-8]|uniref:VPLPA-CTERM sorting domain-containing protein n=1 Tax=Sedimentitalea xiamensis TaxID=3050037 RepID=A0ABT7FBJ1_9RHOB|nr:VPLPA-CTERM sorting domain-containing protein [Sedimentitalea xiamensis]MDK3072435.1 VPLPA-CTERM sorting domain-containing protein [Sedimentitalea xiamensis]
MELNFRAALCAGGLALGALVAFGPAANAASVTVDLDYEFSGATMPSSPLKLTINESAVDTLTYTLDASALLASEHVKEFYFNLDPFLSPLTWDLTDTSAAWDSYGEGLDTFKADGDGFFDYRLVFDNANRLSGTEIYSFSITGTDLDLTDIVSKSTASGNATIIGGFYFAAHVGGIPDPAGGSSLSGWITCNHWDQNGGCSGGPTPRSGPPPNNVPVPASLPLLLTALGAAAFMRRRAKASA